MADRRANRSTELPQNVARKVIIGKNTLNSEGLGSRFVHDTGHFSRTLNAKVLPALIW